VRRWLREPLLHFVLLGALIFAGYTLVSRDGGDRADEILVTQAQLAMLATTFAGTWQRPPTADEMDGLIRDYVREEVAAREAVALGLDKDDTVIRRRLRQKLEFISEDLTSRAEPSERELQDYLVAHQDVFRTERRFTFAQVYLDSQRRGERLPRDTDALLAELEADPDLDASTLGDSLLLGNRFDALPASEVAREFGEDFAKQLATLPIARWQGPVRSGYGVHLVRVSQRDEGEMPSLAQSREAVKREWSNAQRTAASEAFYRGLLARYSVKIEHPRAIQGSDKPDIADARR
jgi:parvulin-like peptidyl-prolyl cis-trans isomerase-like protein